MLPAEVSGQLPFLGSWFARKMNTSSSTGLSVWVGVVAALLAGCAPLLVAYSISPSATFLNQATAVVGWGIFLSVVLHGLRGSVQQLDARNAGATALYAALMLLVLSVVVAYWLRNLPSSLALLSALMLLAVLLVVWVGVKAATQVDHGVAVFRLLAWSWVVAGMLSVCVGVVQVFAPNWADGHWLAVSALPGRATGNLRQPNHLGSLLLWALVGLVTLLDLTATPRRRLLNCGAGLTGLCLVLGIVLSASRTAALGLLVLAAWGLLDARLSARARAVLLTTPLLYALIWLGLTQWADATGHAFGGTARFSAQGDISSSRFGVWANALTLVVQQPWVGVGWGNFNFSWSLTPFPNRPVAFFDHAHNLVLQLAVELGVPLAALVLGLLAWAFYKAGLAAWRSQPGAPSLVRTGSWVMLLLMALHSQLEYPLWYAYFLLPSAFLWGLCLAPAPGAPGDTGHAPAIYPTVRNLLSLQLGAFLMIVLGTLAVLDYWRVAVIFSPPRGAAPLEQRIAAGQHSWLFAHQAHYAAATTASAPEQTMASFAITTHHLLDTRLMVAWAKAFNAAGDTERARHLAARLREFHNKNAEAFFAPCTQTPPREPLPFQCTAPQSDMDWRAFR
jgi:O-antigen ligase